MDSLPLIVAIAVFVAIVAVYAAYELGRNNAGNQKWRANQVGVPPVEVMLEYRNATGFTTLRRIRTLAYMPRSAGRSCLFALCNGGTAPRMFRIDRIISVATLDGEIIDTHRFLVEMLGMPV